MKFKPSSTELSEVESYNANERLHYFLTRAVESEEVWGLSNQSGWVMKEANEHTILPVWPYKQLADDCATNEWQNYIPGAVSLEHFVYNLLALMEKEDIKVEVFPTATQPGLSVEANELAAQFEGMIESGEYYMEG